ncbi:MAG: hypothetical protein ACRDFC_03155 [Ignavibacteria bacterium]
MVILIFVDAQGCRDYIAGAGENQPPSVSTNEFSINLNDSVVVYLNNRSLSAIYVIGAYNYIEKKDGEIWITYDYLNCSGGCPEISVPSKSIISNVSTPIHDSGTFRFVCLYSVISGTSNEEKIKLFSNEIVVQ